VDQYKTPGRRSFWLGLLLLLSTAQIAAQPEINGPDPFDSPLWHTMHERFLSGGSYVFDPKIEVLTPAYAEDSLNVPVYFRAHGIERVLDIAVFADLNPIPMVLRFNPINIDPALAFSFKLQQSTPIRVAVLDEQGLWHIGTQWISAAGGGCTAPSVGMASGNWTETFGAVSAGLFEQSSGNRLKMQIMHPMDTGLAEGIPRFHIEHLELKDPDTNVVLADLQLFEPVSENPLLSFDIGGKRNVVMSGFDNNANVFGAEIRQ